MDAIDQFRLEPLAPDTVRSRLTGGASALELEGQVLEAQFRCPLGYLLITSDGIPFEEALHFYLLDRNGSVLDGLSLGSAYHSGILSRLGVRGDELEFSFFGKERWRLSVLSSPRVLLLPTPWASVRGIHGPFRRHYLKLEKVSDE